MASLNTKNNRNFNLDLIRILAFLLVPCLHFFLYSDFYNFNVTGTFMSLMFFARNLTLMCIPLFLLLTGYLQGNKEITPNKSYYFKITKFLIPYIFIATLFVLTDIFYFKSTYNFKKVLSAYTGFGSYSWYVEMYIGLFLLIPFLNMIWKSMKNTKQELILVGTLVALTLLPSLINTFDLGASNWWHSSNAEYWVFIPDWWISVYPVTYYFAGAFLKKHQSEFKLRAIHWFVLFAASTIILNVFYLIRNYGDKPSVYGWLYWDSITLFIPAVFLFMFISSLRIKSVPSALSRFVGLISDLTFGAYLASAIGDKIIYPIVNGMFADLKIRAAVAPLTLTAVIISSLIISLAAHFAYKGFLLLAEKTFSKEK